MYFSTHKKPQSEKKSNTIGLLIQAAPVLFKKKITTVHT